jgi:hypothetical protein
MKRMRITGLCLVAVFALTAIGAGSAFGSAEVGRCVAKAGGKYKNSNCTEKQTGGSFEFVKSPAPGKEHFTSAGGEGVLETVSGTKIVCKTQSAVGKYDPDGTTTLVTKEVEEVVASFEGCSIPALETPCQSGAEEGKISTFSLKGPLGYISGEKTKTPVVGQSLTPTKAKGLFAEFKCLGGAITVKVKGKEGSIEGRTGGNCVIAPVESPNVMSVTATQTYSGSGGKQSPQHFQLATAKYCNLESNTNGGAFEAATQALTTVVTNEEALEIKA